MTETYYGDLSVGDEIVYAGEVCEVVDIEGIPLTEDEYYGPAKPDRKTFTVLFGDGTIDEFTRWESDVVTTKEA
jgi:hypothetical protein